MKNKRLWLSVALTVLVVVCAMLILSRVNEARSNAAPAAPTDLILPPDIQTTAKPDVKKVRRLAGCGYFLLGVSHREPGA